MKNASIKGIDHVSLLVKNTQQSVRFYQSILGLEPLERPDLGFPGAWLSLGGNQTLHLLELANPYENLQRPEHGGRDQHFALRVSGFEVFKQKLESSRIPFTQSRSGRKALFFKDLDNNVIELFEV